MSLHVESKAVFDAEVINYSGAGVIVHYWASWCPPAVELNDFLDKSIAPVFEDVRIVLVDVTKAGELCGAQGVESVPHVVFYRQGSAGKQAQVAHVDGAKLGLIQQNASSIFGTAKDRRAAFDSLDAYVQHTVAKDHVVIFITGTPSEPICGFTTKLVALLQKYNVPFTFYDIMADDEVCQRLKTFSNWPTYPQVYVDGKLVGGLDIVLELEKEGEFEETFGVAKATN